MDKYRLFFSETAEADLNEIAAYIAEELREPDSALKLVQQIRADVASLASLPERHELVQEERLAKRGVRKMLTDHYLTFYTVERDPKTVTIIRILYGRREWTALL